MKKLMIALALVGFSTTAMAQETEVPSHKYSVATNSFWANWFVSVGADYNAAYTSQEVNVHKSPFSKKRGTFGFDVAVGKWFTPGIGLRTKFQGLWSKRVISNSSHKSYEYWNLHEDVMFNLSNIFFGYNEKRVWNFIPYVGIGVNRNMSDNVYDITYNAGLLNNFRISNKVSVFLDLYVMATEGSFDMAEDDIWMHYNKDEQRHWDKMTGASVGITYNLGKSTWEKAPDVNALMAMNKEQMDVIKNLISGELKGWFNVGKDPCSSTKN